MLEIVHRELSARILRWQRHGATVTTPALALVADPGPIDVAAAIGRVLPNVPLGRLFDLTIGEAPGAPHDVGFHLTYRCGFAPPDEQASADVDLAYPVATAAPLSALRFSESTRQARRGAEDTDRDDETGGAVRRLWLEVPPSTEPLLVERQEIALLAAAASHYEDPERFAPLATKARSDAGWGRALYAPLLGRPADLALLAYCGIDLIDATPLELATLEGTFLAADDAFPVGAHPQCLCAGCLAGDPAADRDVLLAHNLLAARTELGAVRHAIATGTLRNLVERRARGSPHRTALLRRLDEEAWHYEGLVAVTGTTATVPATGLEALTRPDVAAFRRWVTERHRRPEPARVLLILPCSAAKPYSRSRTHRRFIESLETTGRRFLLHEVMVTSPLGLVPRELEALPPASTYDAAVTGVWDAEEVARIRETVAGLLARNAYDRVIVHASPETHAVLAPVLPADALLSLHASPARGASLAQLEAAVRNATHGMRVPSFPERRLADLKEHARYLFGEEAADRILAGCTLRGRWPHVRGEADRKQVFAHVPERGTLSLTMEGARRLWATRTRWVAIDDFTPRGTLFAVGVVAADPAIRRGDEVVLVHGPDPAAGDAQLRGVGRAVATGREMAECKRGPCVEVRHHA